MRQSCRFHKYDTFVGFVKPKLATCESRRILWVLKFEESVRESATSGPARAEKSNDYSGFQLSVGFSIALSSNTKATQG